MKGGHKNSWTLVGRSLALPTIAQGSERDPSTTAPDRQAWFYKGQQDLSAFDPPISPSGRPHLISSQAARTGLQTWKCPLGGTRSPPPVSSSATLPGLGKGEAGSPGADTKPWPVRVGAQILVPIKIRYTPHPHPHFNILIFLIFLFKEGQLPSSRKRIQWRFEQFLTTTPPCISNGHVFIFSFIPSSNSKS